MWDVGKEIVTEVVNEVTVSFFRVNTEKLSKESEGVLDYFIFMRY
jgi:hypothetical protein